MINHKPQLKFPNTNRIRKSKDFIKCNKIGKRQKSKNFLLIFTPSATTASRLGLVVSKKVDKRAVCRNRIKRQIREIFRNHKHLFSDPIDIVVIARQNAKRCSHAEVKEEILKAFKKASILREDSNNLCNPKEAK